MKHTAVIFDLFGTLVDNLSHREHERVLTQMAEALCVPRDEFVRLWHETSEQRAQGLLHSPEGNIEYACQQLGVKPEDSQRKFAARIRSDYTRRSIVPRSDAISVLRRLKSTGHSTGLISDCSSETPIVWKDTPLAPLIDATVFSCLAGVKKPDPRIYHLAAGRLAVRPEECLYVADGVGRELEAASQVGMSPVLIRVPYDDTPDAARIDEEDWDGPRVSSLTEVLPLLDQSPVVPSPGGKHGPDTRNRHA